MPTNLCPCSTAHICTYIVPEHHSRPYNHIILVWGVIQVRGWPAWVLGSGGSGLTLYGSWWDSLCRVYVCMYVYVCVFIASCMRLYRCLAS